MTYPTKTCNKCKEEKPLDQFNKHKKNKDGLSYSCKYCKKEYYKENQERMSVYWRNWYKKNKEKKSEYKKEHYQKNKEEILRKKKIYRQQEHIKEQDKEYRKKYREQNREKINALQNQYAKDRKKHDLLYKCRVNTRVLISKSFSNQNLSKKSKTFKILGCSPEWFYNEWLEKKYNPPHSHLDHIIPISLAQNEKEVILLNHYSNFQVLSPEQNISKGNKYISLQGLNKVLANHPYVKDVKYIIKREGIEVR